MDLSPPQPPPRPRLGGRGPAIVSLVGFLLAVGAFVAVLVVLDILPSPVPTPADRALPTPTASPSKLLKSARFAKQDECVQNVGTGSDPEMILVTCTDEVLVVLERLEGTVDYTRCEKVKGYRYHYYYDSELGDKFDFVLCMRKWSG